MAVRERRADVGGGDWPPARAGCRSRVQGDADSERALSAQRCGGRRYFQAAVRPNRARPGAGSLGRAHRGRRVCAGAGTVASVLSEWGPIRDEGHASLLQRLHGRCHSSLVWRTEVPFPAPGDRRAWDAVIRGASWRAGVEAETRPNDLQALDRKLALKERDGEADWLILLMLASRHNRALLTEHGSVLRARFPLDARRALERLGTGVPLGGNALILL
jgi:hypothetical protein